MDELKNVMSDSSFIPEGCLSFVEESEYIVAAIDEDFEELMETAGLVQEESAAPEVDGGESDAGQDAAEATTESAEAEAIDETAKEKAAAFGGKIVDFLKGIWAKIKNAFEKVVEWINGQVSDAKSKGYAKLVAKFDKAEFKAGKDIGKFHPAKNIANVAWIGSLKAEGIGKGAAASSGGSVNINEIPGRVVQKAAGQFISNCDIKTMKKELGKFFLGEEVKINATNFANYKNQILDIAVKNGSIKSIKAAYNEARKKINELISAAKKIKGDKKDRAAAEINVLRRYGQVLATGVAVQLDAARKQYREALGITIRIASKFAKKEKPEKEEKKKEEAKTEAVDIFAW